jgi:hypothetical protein
VQGFPFLTTPSRFASRNETQGAAPRKAELRGLTPFFAEAATPGRRIFTDFFAAENLLDTD